MEYIGFQICRPGVVLGDGDETIRLWCEYNIGIRDWIADVNNGFAGYFFCRYGRILSRKHCIVFVWAACMERAYFSVYIICGLKLGRTIRALRHDNPYLLKIIKSAFQSIRRSSLPSDDPRPHLFL